MNIPDGFLVLTDRIHVLRYKTRFFIGIVARSVGSLFAWSVAALAAWQQRAERSFFLVVGSMNHLQRYNCLEKYCFIPF